MIQLIWAIPCVFAFCVGLIYVADWCVAHDDARMR